MLVDWTNHLGQTITNHLGTVIQLEQSGARDIYLQAVVDFNLDVVPAITREQCLSASLEIVNDYTSNITREKLLNRLNDTALGWTNHLGQSITNHLGENIYLIPPHGMDFTMGIDGDVAKHVIMGDASISISGEIVGEITRHRLLQSDIDFVFDILASDLRERYLESSFEITNEIEAELTRERQLYAEIDYNLTIDGFIKKAIGWWETIIIKFKE